MHNEMFLTAIRSVQKVVQEKHFCISLKKSFCNLSQNLKKEKSSWGVGNIGSESAAKVSWKETPRHAAESRYSLLTE